MFLSQNPGASGLYLIRSDGSGAAKRLTEGLPTKVPTSFSPDGKSLDVFQTGNGGSLDIFTMTVEADPGVRLGKAELFLGTPFGERHAAFSLDGRWLAYASNESGTYEVYVRPYPGPGGRWQVSTGGGRLPVWSRPGRQAPGGDPRRRCQRREVAHAPDVSAALHSTSCGGGRRWGNNYNRAQPGEFSAPGGYLEGGSQHWGSLVRVRSITGALAAGFD